MGRSPAGLGIQNLRPRIVTILSEALHHPNAKRNVYLLDQWGEHTMESKGRLAQALYAALGQVVALPD